MTANVINLYAPEEEPPINPANSYMESFIDWANAQGIDTSDDEFRHDSAVIMITIKNMLLKAGVA